MKRFLLGLAILLRGLSLCADEFSFEHFGTAQGMAQTAIASIVQDASGNIWFIGDGKIFRYDGFECDFWSDAAPVYCLTVDDCGGIWALCGKKLMAFDDASCSFVERESGPEWLDRQYYGLYGIGGGKLLLFNGGEYSLAAYDIENKSFATVIPEAYNITAVLESGPRIFFGCSDGSVCVLDSLNAEPRQLSKCASAVSSLLLDEDGKLWVGTRGDGLYKIDASVDEHYTREAGRLSSNIVLSLAGDSDGKIWAGTLVGLNIIEKGGRIQKLVKDNFNPESLSHNTVRCILRDRQGGMWLGTYFGGINYWHPFRNRFRHIRPDAGGNSINDDVISCIVEDESGLVWVGTNMGGVNCYDPSGGEFKHYLVAGPSGRSSEFNDVKAILCDGDIVLVGAHGAGLSVIDKNRGTVSNGFPWKSVYALAKADDGSYLIGTTAGVHRLDPSLKNPVKCSKGRFVSILHDSLGRLWISYFDRTELFSSDRMQENIAPQELAQLSGIYDVFEGSGGRFWLSAPSGLYLYDDESGLRQCPEFADMKVCGVEQDGSGNLWVACSAGLCRFNPSKGKLRRFTSADGLAVSVFQEYSHCRMNSGEMMFGGIGGIDIFNPDTMTADAFCPDPVINAIYINGREKKPVGPAVRLKNSQKHITFRFSAPDFDSGRLTRFHYRLFGFDKRWQETGRDRIATYSNLPRGRYILSVFATNPDGAVSEGRADLSVRVLPPWYSCNAAILVWIALFFSVLIFSWRTALRHRDMANELKLQKLEKEHQKEISRLKVLKFINSGAQQGDSPGRKIVTEIDATDEHFMLEVMGLVEGNISNPDFNTEMLARKMNISRTSLFLRVKKITGASPLDLIHKIRFSRACELLDEAKLTVAEIAYKVGSRSPSAFIAAFRKYYGTTPTEYVRRAGN